MDLQYRKMEQKKNPRIPNKKKNNKKKNSETTYEILPMMKYIHTYTNNEKQSIYVQS